MNHKIQIFILFLGLASFSACSNSQASSEGRETIVFNDGYSSEDKNEIVITENDLKQVSLQVATAHKDLQETTVAAQDNSEIVTMYDSMGNKIETRRFKEHSRLRSLILRTSNDGKQQIFVYGFGTDVKTLSGEIANKLMTASGDEIANAAGIYETRSNKGTTNFMKPANSLQPLPSSEFPVRMPPDFSSQNPDNEQDTASRLEENSPNLSERKD